MLTFHAKEGPGPDQIGEERAKKKHKASAPKLGSQFAFFAELLDVLARVGEDALGPLHP